jgi:hypothetical protein
MTSNPAQIPYQHIPYPDLLKGIESKQLVLVATSEPCPVKNTQG